MSPERRAELREFFVSNLFANEILDALDAAEESASDGLRMVGAFVVETDEETQERAKARYAASPGPVHDLVTMAQEVERYRAVLRDFRDNWDHGTDAHVHGTPCRCCMAEAALGEGA